MPEYYAFVNLERAKELGIDPKSIMGPWDARNSKIVDYMFPYPINQRDLQEYQRLERDTRYLKISVAGN